MQHTESIRIRRALCKFYLIWEECRRHDLIFNKNTQNGGKCPHSAILRREVSPLGGVYLSFELNWEECRRRDLIFNKNTQNGGKCPHSAEYI